MLRDSVLYKFTIDIDIDISGGFRGGRAGSGLPPPLGRQTDANAKF